MANFADKKIAEGNNFLKEAEKCLKTGLLKWKPDYESAATEYGNAAVAFKNGKAYEQSINAYIKQAEALKQTGSIYQAAKSLEMAGLACKDIGDLNKAIPLIEEATLMFLENGTPSSASVMLDKAAKMIENTNPEKAIEFYKKAFDVSEMEDRVRDCAENIGKAARLLIRTKRYDEAADALSKEIMYNSKVEHGGQLFKLMMPYVIVHLYRGDYVAADQAFQHALRTYPGFAESQEAPPIEKLLEAYNDCDQEEATKYANHQLFRFMENDFAKLARDLKVPGGGSRKKISSESAMGNQAEEEDDPYGDGLL